VSEAGLLSRSASGPHRIGGAEALSLRGGGGAGHGYSGQGCEHGVGSAADCQGDPVLRAQAFLFLISSGKTMLPGP